MTIENTTTNSCAARVEHRRSKRYHVGKRPNLAVLTRSGGFQAALMDAADSGAQFQGRSSWMRLIG